MVKFQVFAKNGTEVELLCIIGRTEKCPKGALCFKDSVDWYSLRDQFERRYRKEAVKIPNEIDQSTGKDKIPTDTEMGKITKHLKDLYPDSEAMTDYLEVFPRSDPECLCIQIQNDQDDT